MHGYKWPISTTVFQVEAQADNIADAEALLAMPLRPQDILLAATPTILTTVILLPVHQYIVSAPVTPAAVRTAASSAAAIVPHLACARPPSPATCGAARIATANTWLKRGLRHPDGDVGPVQITGRGYVRCAGAREGPG